MFALVDCDSFYASVETVARPDLRGRPVIVLSANDGCVVARSAAAKALGIEMSAAWHLIDPKVRSQVVSFSSNFALYADFSRRVVSILTRFAEEIEVYSVDESFLRFSPGPSWRDLGTTIQRTIMRETGLPVSIGFARTKVLAKAATRVAKKRADAHGVFVLDGDADVAAVLAAMTTDDVWGIGPRLAARLATVGVNSGSQLQQLDAEVARRLLSVVGQRIVLELQGVSCLAIEEIAPAKKLIGSAKSFGIPLSTLDELREPLASYVSVLAAKLRAQRSVAGRLVVFLQTNPFAADDVQAFPGGQTTLDTPTNYTGTLVRSATRLLEIIWRPNCRWKRLGVLLTDLGPEREVQSSFTSEAPAVVEKRRRAMSALDAVNSSFGRGTLRPASAAGPAPNRWQTRHRSLSPRWTTRWSEIPVVRA